MQRISIRAAGRFPTEAARHAAAPLAAPRAGGAVILIVLTLLATLTFLGFFFYAWTNQEQIAARSAATAEDSEIDIEEILNQASEQLLVGTRMGYENSALWGGQQSIVSHIVGPINSSLQPTLDHPFTASGVSVRKFNDGTNDLIGVDYDGDGLYDRVAYYINVSGGVTTYTSAGASDTTLSASGPQGQNVAGFKLNFSRVAQQNPNDDAFNSLYPTATLNPYFPYFNPAAGYTYPDLSSLYLASDSVRMLDLDGDGISRPVHVIVPSFFRPQVMLDRRDPVGGAAGNTTGGITGNGYNGYSSMDIDPATRDTLLRPHALHVNPLAWNVAGNPPIDSTLLTNSATLPTRRFLFVPATDPAAAGIPAQSGDTNRIIRPFEIVYDRDSDGTLDTSGVDIDGDGVTNQMGVYSDATRDLRANLYELDVDNDGDGVNDSIWMDLGLQLIDLPDGRQVMPLVAFKVIDADALFNVNLHGDLAGLTSPDTTATPLQFLIDWDGDGVYDPPADNNSNGILDPGDTPGDVLFPLHRSNMGLSPSEVNIGYALFANPATLPPGAQAQAMQNYLNARMAVTVPPVTYGTSQLSAADLLFLLSGRPAYFSGPFLAGRNGEPALVQNFYNWGLVALPAVSEPLPPRAGLSNFDDDGDYRLKPNDSIVAGGLGANISDSRFNMVAMPPAVHPLDFTGAGRGFLAPPVSGTNHGDIRRMNNPLGTSNPAAWPQYYDPATDPGAVSGLIPSAWQDNGLYDNSNPPNPYGQVANVLPLTQTLNGALQTPGGYAGAGPLVDEADEVTVNSQFPDLADAPFSPSENAGLQLPDADFALTGEQSRLRELAPFNLNDAPSTNEDLNGNLTADSGEDFNGNGFLDLAAETRARLNRKLLTTDSWDRLEFNYNVVPDELAFSGSGGSAMPSEDLNHNGLLDQNASIDEDANGNSSLDRGEDRNGNGQRDSYPHGWEFNIWGGTYYGPRNQYFPPSFEVGGATAPFVGPPETSTDPIRWELRSLLLTRVLNQGVANNFDIGRLAPRLKLNLNQLLIGVDGQGNPEYRPLTPHPVFDGTDTEHDELAPMYHGQHATGSKDPPPVSGAPAFSSIGGNKFNQEWWARYDRQRMARDIYTLLWVLTGGDEYNDYTQSLTGLLTDDTGTNGREDDSFDATTNWGRDRVREMAQFAVNLVDELDHDNVITAFYYDDDLTDGWNDPSKVVYGVEAAQLTFSEGLAVQTLPNADPGNRIDYESATDSRYHMFVELRNASPFNVNISDGQWRLRRVDLLDATSPPPGGIERSITLVDSANGTVGAGKQYLIGMQDGENRFSDNGQPRPSDLRIDYDGDGDYDSICPNYIEASPPTNASTSANYPAPLCDLDLAIASHASRVRRGPPQPPPTWYSLLDDSMLPQVPASGPSIVALVLERRMNGDNAPGLIPNLTDANNPWIEVDRIVIPLRTFNPDPVSSLPAQLLQLKSVERIDPFDWRMQPQNYTGADVNRLNTMPFLTAAAKGSGAVERNSRSLESFTHWQPHFDRDFSSVMELLSVPLYGYGPSEITGITDLDKDKDDDPSDKTGANLPSAYQARMFRVGGPTKNLLDGNNHMSGHRTAAARILYPEPNAPENLVLHSTRRDPDGWASAVTVMQHYRNRWHRLLELVDVPDHVDQAVAGKLRWQRRTPGKINLNTVRNEEVVAGLVDDPAQINPVAFPWSRTSDGPPPNSMSSPWSMTDDILEDPGERNWFAELTSKRDGIDPFLRAISPARAFQLPLPGSLDAKPFRGLSYMNPGIVFASGSRDDAATAQLHDMTSISETLLRARLIDDDTDMSGAREIPDHGLFEARAASDRTGAGAVGGTDEDLVDFHSRERLLAKIANRTTGRSHVFFVWTTVGFFEAHRLAATGEVQIGARAEDLPLRRAFMVCDMSRLEEAYEDPELSDGIPGYFDFRKFIIYRKLIK